MDGRILKIAQRLGVGFGILLCLFGAYSLFALDRIGALTDLAGELHDGPHTLSLLVLRVDHHIRSADQAAGHLLVATDSAQAAALAADAAEHERHAARLLDSIEARYSGDPEALIDARRAFAQWRRTADDVPSRPRAGEAGAAREALDHAFGDRTNELAAALRTLAEGADARSAELTAHARMTREASTGVTLSLLFLTAMIAFGLFVWLTVSVYTPVEEADATARAAGERERDALEQLEYLHGRIGPLRLATTGLPGRDLRSSITAVRRLARDVNGAAGAVSHCAAVLVDFGVAGRTFRQIVKRIEDVADQANRLAGNVTIEAVRSGQEEGGFRVLADEIQGLATRAGRTAQQASAAADVLDSELGRAAAAVHAGGTEIDRAVETTRLARRALGRLARRTASIRPTIDEMNGSTDVDDLPSGAGRKDKVSAGGAGANLQSERI